MASPYPPSGGSLPTETGASFFLHEPPPTALFMQSPRPHITRHGKTEISIGAAPTATSQLQFKARAPPSMNAPPINNSRRPDSRDWIYRMISLIRGRVSAPEFLDSLMSWGSPFCPQIEFGEMKCGGRKLVGLPCIAALRLFAQCVF